MMNPIQWARDRLQIRRDYKEIFETAAGQRVLAHILLKSGVTVPRFTTDIEQTRINEGERRLAMSIFNEVHSSVDKLITQMQDEITKQEQNNTS